MYNFLEYRSSYSDTTVSFWFYSKDESNVFKADIAYNNNNFKSFECKAKLLENTVAHLRPNKSNGILENETIAKPLKYLSNLCRSLEVPLINGKLELKLKWTIFCLFLQLVVLNNTYANPNNIIFTIKDIKLYVPVVILSARDNQKLSKLFSERFERLVFWIEYKTTTENKNTTNEYRYFPESNFVGVKRLLVLTFPSNQDDDARRFKTWRYYVPKSAIKNYNIIINRNNFYDQPIDSDIKRYEEIIKLITGQGDDYTI